MVSIRTDNDSFDPATSLVVSVSYSGPAYVLGGGETVLERAGYWPTCFANEPVLPGDQAQAKVLTDRCRLHKLS